MVSLNDDFFLSFNCEEDKISILPKYRLNIGFKSSKERRGIKSESKDVFTMIIIQVLVCLTHLKSSMDTAWNQELKRERKERI